VVETENFPAMSARPVVSTAAELLVVELKLFLTEILHLVVPAAVGKVIS
jgi:hypothetical protein